MILVDLESVGTINPPLKLHPEAAHLLGLSHILHPRKVSVNTNGHSATRNSDLTHSRKNELESFTEVTSFILLFTEVSSAISF